MFFFFILQQLDTTASKPKYTMCRTALASYSATRFIGRRSNVHFIVGIAGEYALGKILILHLHQALVTWLSFSVVTPPGNDALWASLDLGDGGVEVRNLPQFTAILPHFFSYVSIQNFHFSPEEKFFTPFAVTKYTVRRMCSHLSCMSLVWRDVFLFLCSQNVVRFWEQ